MNTPHPIGIVISLSLASPTFRRIRICGAVGLVIALTVWLAPQQAAAQTQMISLNTGLVGQAGTTTIAFQADDDWYVTADPVVASPLPRLAWVVYPVTTTHMKWNLTLPISQWISGDLNKYRNSLPTPPTHFNYQTCFNLPALFSTPNLTLQMRADDMIRRVRLNGSTILFSDNSTGLNAYASATKVGSFLGPPLLITYNSTAFHAGQNCVDVVVDDEQQMVSGLDVVGTVTYQGPPSAVCSSSGQVILWDLSTGTNFVGVKNPIGAVDPKWSLIAVPTGVPGSAYSTNTIGSWVLNLPQQANWITRIHNTNPQLDDAGVYTYRVPLPSSLNLSLYSSIQIIMRYAADNSAIVRLNGTQVDSCAGPNCFSAWRPTLTLTPTALSSLEVEVTNSGTTYTGLIVDAKLRLVCK